MPLERVPPLDSHCAISWYRQVMNTARRTTTTAMTRLISTIWARPDMRRMYLSDHGRAQVVIRICGTHLRADRSIPTMTGVDDGCGHAELPGLLDAAPGRRDCSTPVLVVSGMPSRSADLVRCVGARRLQPRALRRASTIHGESGMPILTLYCSSASW